MRVSIATPHKKYPIIIEPKAVQQFKFPKRSIVVTDSTVQKKYGQLFSKFPTIVFTPGEAHKRLDTVERMAEKLVELDAHRTSSIIALGGGVVGDMAGFLAAIYMRGIPFYQVPTSLLAMVDASVGGKTGVDLASGKNLVGAFHQPEAVIIDPQVLVDLPEDQFRNGMGEVVKHAVLDAKLFRWLERNADKILERDVDTLATLVAKNVRIKAAIVNADEKEAHQRMLLNLGHTFGHAIEQLSGYSVPHGEAVGMGLMYAAEYTATEDKDRIANLLLKFGLPLHLETPYTAKQMVKVMQSDKKNRGGKITLVLPKAIGDVHIDTTVTSAKVERFMNNYHAEIK